MNQEVLEALNKQLNQELANAYFYLAVAAYFDYNSLKGFANYFKVQAREEVEHAMKIYEYISARGARVDLRDVALPKKDWSSPLDAVRDFYEAERANTQRIWELVDLARKHGDKATEALLQWFVNEQVEEEEQALDLLSKVEMIKGDVGALLALDRVLAERK